MVSHVYCLNVSALFVPGMTVYKHRQSTDFRIGLTNYFYYRF